MMDVLLCGLSASLSSIIGKKVACQFSAALLSGTVHLLSMSQSKLHRFSFADPDSHLPVSASLSHWTRLPLWWNVLCLQHKKLSKKYRSVSFFLAFRHFWAACDCDTKIFFVILQAHILQITQTSMALIEKVWGNKGWNNAASLYLFNWRRTKWLCTCKKKKIRVILPLPFIHHSFILTLLQPWKVLGLGAQDLGSKEEETMPGMWWGKKKLESFPHVNFWLSSSSSSQVCCLHVLLLFPNSLVEYVICTIKPRLLPPRILFMCYVNWPFFLQGETEATDVTPCQNPISFLLGTNQNP